MKTQYKIALGLAGGILAGSAAGLMLAPKSGKETREVITSRAERLRQRGKKSEAAHESEDAFNHRVGA